MQSRFISRAGMALMLTLATTSTVFTQARGQNPGQGQGQGQGQAQGRGGGQGRGAKPPAPAKAAPRWPDGQINLGQVEGEPPGLWEVGAANVPLARADNPSDFGLFAADMREPTDPFLAA